MKAKSRIRNDVDIAKITERNLEKRIAPGVKVWEVVVSVRRPSETKRQSAQSPCSYFHVNDLTGKAVIPPGISCHSLTGK